MYRLVCLLCVLRQALLEPPLSDRLKSLALVGDINFAPSATLFDKMNLTQLQRISLQENPYRAVRAPATLRAILGSLKARKPTLSITPFEVY